MTIESQLSFLGRNIGKPRSVPWGTEYTQTSSGKSFTGRRTRYTDKITIVDNRTIQVVDLDLEGKIDPRVFFGNQINSFGGYPIKTRFPGVKRTLKYTPGK